MKFPGNRHLNDELFTGGRSIIQMKGIGGKTKRFLSRFKLGGKAQSRPAMVISLSQGEPIPPLAANILSGTTASNIQADVQLPLLTGILFLVLALLLHSGKTTGHRKASRVRKAAIATAAVEVVQKDVGIKGTVEPKNRERKDSWSSSSFSTQSSHSLEAADHASLPSDSEIEEKLEKLAIITWTRNLKKPSSPTAPTKSTSTPTESTSTKEKGSRCKSLYSENATLLTTSVVVSAIAAAALILASRKRN